MNDLAICVATMTSPNCPEPEKIHTSLAGSIALPGEITGWTAHASTILPVHIKYNTPEHNLGVAGSYQSIYENSAQTLLCYLHDDVVCHETFWDQRVVKEFEDPQVGVVGFGGGLDHGTADIYKTPYRLQQLARGRYRSNTVDAEAHGERFSAACDVAVLDGFAVVVRRALLDRAGGWPHVPGGFHCYDYAICALAHRYGYRVRLVGVRCHHLGGRTSTTPQYQTWLEKSRQMSDQQTHEVSHRWFYDEYRDVIPWRC